MSGQFPFKGSTKDELNKNIAGAIVEFSGIEWDSISEACKNFIRCCLKFDVNERWSAEQLLKHEWFRKNFKKELNIEVA